MHFTARKHTGTNRLRNRKQYIFTYTSGGCVVSITINSLNDNNNIFWAYLVTIQKTLIQSVSFILFCRKCLKTNWEPWRSKGKNTNWGSSWLQFQFCLSYASLSRWFLICMKSCTAKVLPIANQRRL